MRALSTGLRDFVGRFLGKKRPSPPPRLHTPAVMPQVDSSVFPGQPERRRSPRRWGNPIAVQITQAWAQADPVEGWVLNRSESGLCLSLRQEVPAGSTMTVRVATAPTSIPWVPLEVKYCCPHQSRWKVGCHFAQTPPKEVLVLFG